MNDLIKYLLDYAFDREINLVLAKELDPSFPSCAISARRSILINLNWKNHNELPFIIAHEIAHILEDDPGVCYYSSATSRVKIEARANSRAIGLMLGYCQVNDIDVDNPLAFCDCFGVPTEYAYLVYLKLDTSNPDRR